MDENNIDHCQVFDGSGEKLSVEVFLREGLWNALQENSVSEEKSPAYNCKAKLLKDLVLIHLQNIFKNIL